MSSYPEDMNKRLSNNRIVMLTAPAVLLSGVVIEVFAQDVSGRTPPSMIDSEKTPLLPSDGLDGWNLVSGEATIEYEDGVLRGHSAGDRNAFLMSERTWGDFVLEGEVLIEPGGNSGWQIRSGIDDPEDLTSRLRGYQIEVETTDRRWSGGIYEEGRRGWLDTLLDDEEARASFKIGEWNRYRIEADGLHLRSWVNGVPCGDLLDLSRMKGHIAFQVHTGSCDVRWRDLEIVDLGRSRFISSGTWHSVEKRVGDDRSRMLKFTPGVETSTIRFEYPMKQDGVLSVMDQDQRRIMEISLHGDDPVISSIGTPCRFPEVAPGAGMDITKDSKHHIVIDLHQGRITVIRDGVVLLKRFEKSCSSIGGLVIHTSGSWDESADSRRIRCLVRERSGEEAP